MKGSNKLRAFILISVMALFCGSSLFMLPSFAETDTVAVQEEAENTEETTAEMPEETAPPQQSEVTQATQGLQGAEVQPTEETLPAEEPMEEDALKQRDIKAEVVNESLYKDKEKEHPTEAYKKVIRFWKALTGRRAAAGEDEMNLKVTVSGKLPEGVTAQARLIPLEDKAVFTEQGLFSFALLLLDENGSPYIPADPVKVTVQGKALKQEISEDNALLLYVWLQAPERAEKYAEKYDRAIYAADVEVYKSKSVRDKYLNYEVYDKNKEYRDGEDAVRYTEDKDGLRCDSDSAAFAYDYSAFAGRAETDQTGGIRLLLSVQTVICGSKVDRTERHDANGAENDNGIFDFSRSVTQGGPIDLYACWSSPDTVKVRILDASAKDIVLYGSTEISVPVGTREVAVNEELLGDSKPPASYSYAFAAPCSASGNLNSISADDTVTALYFNTAEQKVFVKYADGRADAPLADGSDICFVYYQKKALDIHVALVGDDGIRVDDTRRADNHQVNLSPGERVNMLTALPAGDLFAGDHEKYGFGAIAYGTHNDDGDVDVQGLGVSAISCEQADGNIYDLLLKDDQGNTITRLDAGQELYYLYYPMPKIRYVKKADNGDLISITGSIYNSAEVLVPYDDVTYNHDTFVLNGVEVKQNQNVQIPLEGLVISNASGSKNFKMPSVLDDGMFERYLKYSEIGIRNDADGHAASTADFDDAHNGHLNDRMVLYLQIRDNRLKWSFDGDSWDNMSGAPTIYAIYTDRGYELQVSKAVDTSAFSGDDSVDRSIFTEKEFTVTVSSAQITKPEYEIEGADASEVQINSGSIVLTVRDGSRIKIKGLRQGTDYRITESGKENYLLTAKTGPINGTASEEYTPGETFALDSGRQVALTNTPKPLCQITYNDTDHIFYTLQSAVSYVNRNIPSRKADVEMLTDYLMPEKDTMTIPVGFAIKLTTAREYNGAGGNTAIITRSDAVSRSAMLDNKGTLTLEQVVIDGANSKADEAMIHSTGSLTVTGGSILQNGERAEEGTGGAIYATGDSLTINGGAELRGNRAANGGAVYYAGSGTVTVDGGETVLTDNHATEGGHGGAIYAAGGSVELTGGMFNSNTAEGHGGAVYSAAALISVKGGLLDRNSAASGGAIYADAGTITVSGDTAVISGNTAGGRGGAIGTSSGTVEISKGRLTGNRAPNGFGGAVYADSGTVRVSGGVIGRETESSSDTETNTAKNGAAVYINTGKGYFSGGNIVRNMASEGGAVGVGGESAGLYFSGKINIRDNKQGTGESAFESNVYLDQDTDAVINANGLDAQSGEKPYIGIHVPNDVFDSRGGVGAKFGSYTLDGDAAASRLTAFHNDREPNLGAVANTGLKKLYWGKPIIVQVRYLGSYAQGFPDGLNGTILQGNPYTYYPTGGDVAMST
ncbi:MAG: hypothetical protein Q4F96_01605, partial [Bacillota bacterium]|nr:hypothetical protein [Bacillota bacterium]